MKKLMVVEDDNALGYVVRDNLLTAGYEVELCVDGLAAWEKFNDMRFDLLILDIMLPKLDGFSLAEKIREVDAQIPIIFLSAKSMLDDRLEGLRKGGDDYLTKPFSMDELVLKIEVFLRRSSGLKKQETYSIGNYIFSPLNFMLKIGDKEKVLTPKESELLALLCSRKGIVLKREEILNQIWGSDDYFLGRSMDVFISKLRKHLKDDKKITIVNYHGIGFRLEIDD